MLGTKRNWKEGIASFIAWPVYHGTMKVRRPALGALVLALTIASGCAGAREHAIAFEPGQHTARVQDVRVDVVHARYAANQLTLRCAVTNESDAPLTIGREGILLDDDGLELPPLDIGVPADVTVGAGTVATVELVFGVHALEPTTRTLGLWQLTAGDAVVPPLRVVVPGIRMESA
jgi:hypothetical protein